MYIGGSMTEVYLGGPIGKMTIEEANGWRKSAEKFLNNIGIVARNPLRGKTEKDRNSYTISEIVMRDKIDIQKSDIVLVYWPERVISNGTAMEIEYAYDLGKIILFVGDWGKDDIWLNYHVTKFIPTLPEALEYISLMLH
jgi:nucleoside 2-deoxyribosyltransferase